MIIGEWSLPVLNSSTFIIFSLPYPAAGDRVALVGVWNPVRVNSPQPDYSRHGCIPAVLEDCFVPGESWCGHGGPVLPPTKGLHEHLCKPLWGKQGYPEWRSVEADRNSASFGCETRLSPHTLMCSERLWLLTPARSKVACSANTPAKGKAGSNLAFQVGYWKPGWDC